MKQPFHVVDPVLNLKRFATWSISFLESSPILLWDFSYKTSNWMHQISKMYFVFRASSVPISRSHLLYARQLVRFMQVSTVRLELRSNLTLLGSGHITCMKRTSCRAYSRWLLMIDTEDVRNMQFYDKINFGYLVHLVGCFIRNLSRCTVTWT